MTKSVKILSIDGGGSWALIPIRALQNIYGLDATGHNVLKNFDYVVANSGGSIVVAGLMANMKLSGILNFFMQQSWRDQLFQKLPWYKRIPRLMDFGPKYKTSQKLIGLHAALGDFGGTGLNEIKIKNNKDTDIRFAFMAYDYDRDRAKFLRTYDSQTGSLNTKASRLNLAEAVHASSNAPIDFFDEPAQVSSNKRYWDGALTGNNNPVLAGVVEAIGNGAKPEQIGVLSIGTGSTYLPMEGDGSAAVPAHAFALFQAKAKSCLKNDIEKAAKTVLNDPPDAASFIAHVMLGGAMPSDTCKLVSSPIVRMNPLIQPVRDTQNNWIKPACLTIEDFKTLVDLKMDATAQTEVDLIQRFCNLWINDTATNTGVIPNQPIRSNGDLSCEIGCESFTAAKAQWLAM